MTSPRRMPTLAAWRQREERVAWSLIAPAVAVLAVLALVPIVWTAWESLHLHDLRMPWRGRPFIGLANYREAVGDARFREAMRHTVAFVGISVTLEVGLGLGLAALLDSVTRGRGALRTVTLLPWAVPTVVVALMWRFMFESPGGLVSVALAAVGIAGPTWFAHPLAAWVPIILADVWKTTPFVALLLLAGLQQIDRHLYEAADVDGAPAWRQFVEISLPLLRGPLLVAVLFRALDAFRVFDIIYVLSGGGPGTATESIAVYAFATTLRGLRFGFGAAVSMMIFAVAFVAAVVTVRLLGDAAGRTGAA